MLLMLARQQAYSSYGGFAKLASFFFSFFFKIFFGSQGWPPFSFHLFFFFFFFFFLGGGELGAPRVVLDIPMGWGFKVGI